MAAKQTPTRGGRREPAPRRAIAYLRVSTQIQADEGFGLDVQRDRVAEHARAHGLELVDVVTEAASGGVQNGEEFSWEHRPVLLELMARAERGEYDVLIVPRYDRLSRDYATLVVLERRFQRYGVELVSAAETEANGDSAIGEFIRGQLALAAQLERAMIRDRLSAGKAKARQQGRHTEGSYPFGYRSGSRRGLLEPVPEFAAIVKQMFVDCRDGRSLGRIARELDQAGVPSPRGKLWSRAGVHLILTNAAYCGERHGVRKAHPAIVSRRLFNEAQAALARRARRSS